MIQRSSGYSLIETLLALAVVATGMLGAAGYLNLGFGQMQSATRHSTAALLASDLAGRIRAHAPGAAAFANPAAACNAPEVCAAQAGALASLADWSATAQLALPEFAVAIADQSSAGERTLQLELTWTDPRLERGRLVLPVALPAG